MLPELRLTAFGPNDSDSLCEVKATVFFFLFLPRLVALCFLGLLIKHASGHWMDKHTCAHAHTHKHTVWQNSNSYLERRAGRESGLASRVGEQKKKKRRLRGQCRTFFCLFCFNVKTVVAQLPSPHPKCTMSSNDGSLMDCGRKFLCNVPRSPTFLLGRDTIRYK